MRAILINPENQTVTDIQIGEDFTEISKAIDCDTFDCPLVYDNNDALYCDDEGLFKPQKGGAIMDDWGYPVLGKMLVLGTDEDGNSVDAKSDLQFFIDKIEWLDEGEAEAYRSNF